MKRLVKNGAAERCPFCKGDILLADVRDPETRRNVTGLVHTLPVCARFTLLNADDFIHAAEQAGVGPS